MLRTLGPKGNVEVLAGLMQLFHTKLDYVELVGPDGVGVLEAWNRDKIAGEFAFELVPDSSEHLDVDTKIGRVLKMYNLMANSSSIRKSALEKELIEYMGFDPAKLMNTQPPEHTDPPNVSFRFNGADLLNPLATAIMQKGGITISMQDIQQAQALIHAASAPAPVPPGQPMPPQPGAPPAPPPPGPPVTPPDVNQPILKRAEGGARLESTGTPLK